MDYFLAAKNAEHVLTGGTVDTFQNYYQQTIAKPYEPTVITSEPSPSSSGNRPMIWRMECKIYMDKESGVLFMPCRCVTPPTLRYRVRVTDPERQQRILTSLLQAQYFHHAYNLVEWESGKLLGLTLAQTEELLTFLAPDEVPQAFISHQGELALITDADTIF